MHRLTYSDHLDRGARSRRDESRPPVTETRLHLTSEGQVRLELRQPWRDGTTDVVFDPVEFLERLAVLVPRPRINLILYHGVLGPGRPGGLTWAGARRQGKAAMRG